MQSYHYVLSVYDQGAVKVWLQSNISVHLTIDQFCFRKGGYIHATERIYKVTIFYLAKIIIYNQGTNLKNKLKVAPDKGYQ